MSADLTTELHTIKALLQHTTAAMDAAKAAHSEALAMAFAAGMQPHQIVAEEGKARKEVSADAS